MTRQPSPWKLSGVGGNRWERRFIPRHSACKSWPMGAAAMVRGCGCGKLNFRNWPRNWASPSKFATSHRRLANGTKSSTGCFRCERLPGAISDLESVQHPPNVKLVQRPGGPEGLGQADVLQL